MSLEETWYIEQENILILGYKLKDKELSKDNLISAWTKLKFISTLRNHRRSEELFTSIEKSNIEFDKGSIRLRIELYEVQDPESTEIKIVVTAFRFDLKSLGKKKKKKKIEIPGKRVLLSEISTGIVPKPTEILLQSADRIKTVTFNELKKPPKQKVIEDSVSELNKGEFAEIGKNIKLKEDPELSTLEVVSKTLDPQEVMDDLELKDSKRDISEICIQCLFKMSSILKGSHVLKDPKVQKIIEQFLTKFLTNNREDIENGKPTR